MPLTVFDAIRENISSFLGGAEVDLQLIAPDISRPESGIREIVSIESSEYLFSAERASISFTPAEKAFCRELLTAFVGLYSGFNLEGYAAHFRTALLASIMDITVARSLRGDHNKGFWPIQQLIQLLKDLSYQRYEGKPATTGFIVHRTTMENIRTLVRARHHVIVPLSPPQTVSSTFFNNPLTYRLVDGTNQFFLANIQMQVIGALRIGDHAGQNNVERLTQRELFSLGKPEWQRGFCDYG